MKTCRLVLPSVLIVLVLQLGLSWAQTPKYGGTLRIALFGEPAFFNAIRVRRRVRRRSLSRTVSTTPC